MMVCRCCGLISACRACEVKLGRCFDCGKPVLPRSTRCRSCHGKQVPRPIQTPKIDWPLIDRLNEMVAMLGYLETSRRLGVSATAVRKHLLRVQSTALPDGTCEMEFGGIEFMVLPEVPYRVLSLAWVLP